MNKLIGLILCLFAVNLNANMEQFPAQISKQLKLDTLNTKHLNDNQNKAEAATIFSILAHTQELRIHQMGGASENKIYLHKDGHSEAVYDGEGKLVEDCLNQASYNYYNPYQYPLAHFTADILPWLLWGNCKEDPSTIEQRIEAYIQDLRLGFQRVTENGKGYYLPKDFAYDSYGQSVAISFFLKALEASDFDFQGFVPANINNKEQQELFFKALENGFKKLLTSA